MMAADKIWISTLIFQDLFFFRVVLGMYEPNIVEINCCGPWTPILAEEILLESEAKMIWDYTNRHDVIQHMDRSTHHHDYYLDDLGPQLYMPEETFIKPYKKKHV